VALIRLEGIKKSFWKAGSELVVLDGLEFEIDLGEFVAIMGKSGSGKSTLMNILGLLDTPTAGQYELAGADVVLLNERQLARLRNEQLGFVFQRFHLLPRMSARENVEIPLTYSKLDRPEQRALDALQRVGLGDRLGHTPEELSGGQQQRVAIARALVTNPSVILADEPTGNLDAKSADSVLQLLADLNEAGATIVMITHDEDAAARAQRVFILRDGKLHAQRDAKGATA
jgi:putative ABC transport system ATP-binding protein